MGALDTFIGIGKGLDNVFLNSAGQRTHQAIKGQNAQGEVRDAVLSGDNQGAVQAGIRGGLVDPLEVAQSRITAEGERQQRQQKFLVNTASYLDSLPPQQQSAYLAAHGDVLREFGDLDDEDFSLIQQTIGVPGGFRALAQSSLDPQAQFDNAQTTRGQVEDERAARAGEGLRRGELGVSQGRLGLEREKFAFDQQTAPQDREIDQQKLRRDEFKDTQSLRKEFTQITSDFRDTQSSIERIRSVAALNSSQGDLALIVAFTKLLDPGSVAREGEVQLTQTSASAIQQALNIRNKFVEGQTILPADVRSSFVNAAEELFENYEQSFDKRAGEFRDIASGAGLNPERVVVGRNSGPVNDADLSSLSDDDLDTEIARLKQGG